MVLYSRQEIYDMANKQNLKASSPNEAREFKHIDQNTVKSSGGRRTGTGLRNFISVFYLTKLIISQLYIRYSLRNNNWHLCRA